MTVAALLPEFEQEMANTRMILERLPDDRFGSTPHEKSSSLGKLANRLAAMPSLATAVIKGQAKRMPDTDSKAGLLDDPSSGSTGRLPAIAGRSGAGDVAGQEGREGAAGTVLALDLLGEHA
jgi:hypothetical protein